MPCRNVLLVENEIYHVFNRGIMRLPVFLTPKDYKRFIALLAYYRFSNTPQSYSKFIKLPLEIRNQTLHELQDQGAVCVEILAYCLMPNHFHLILRQKSTNGITLFMRNVLNGYTKYFNTKNNRIGPLWQSIFKAVRIESDEQFLHTCRYVHLNPATAFLIRTDELAHYPWSSYAQYLQTSASTFVTRDMLKGFYRNTIDFAIFTLDQADYQQTLAHIKHLLREYP